MANNYTSKLKLTYAICEKLLVIGTYLNGVFY